MQVGTSGDLASPLHGEARIDDIQAQDLKNGLWYFNLHSAKYPAAKFADPSFGDEVVWARMRRIFLRTSVFSKPPSPRPYRPERKHHWKIA
jgi:hypothetical protein